MNLSFDNNWRRVLLMTKQADRNIDRPVSYIVLDKSKLPCTIKKFCQQFSYDLGFDYDLTSEVLWPIHDNISAVKLAEDLNKTFPKCASVTEKIPSKVHSLNFNDDLDSLNF